MWKPHQTCEHEADVRELGRSNADSPALRAHIEACAACRETLVAATWMHKFAALPVAGPLPDPMHIWLRAEMLRRWDAQRQAVTPIDVGEQIQVGVGLVGATALLAWLWSRLDTLRQPPVLPSALTVMLIVSAVLLAGAVSIVARQWMTRE